MFFLKCGNNFSYVLIVGEIFDITCLTAYNICNKSFGKSDMFEYMTGWRKALESIRVMGAKAEKLYRQCRHIDRVWLILKDEKAC